MQHDDPGYGRFCWLDLAAADAQRARVFYGSLFGWQVQAHAVGQGSIGRFRLGGKDVATLYQLDRARREAGVPSHWTAYVAVRSADAAAEAVATLGGEVVVRPFDVPGIARIALAVDPLGAHFGIWQDIARTGAPVESS